ncbi:YdcF family protein [Staphylococcus felis]|uniref:YdcF family protein n=1 Tax=Staphylococcus felis TaxID=46127 RepID=UPI0015F249A8|nr:YdcF family protein [Staphylococcus felis]UXR87255.1 YdcF family protein [Staphylococcus felis]
MVIVICLVFSFDWLLTTIVPMILIFIVLVIQFFRQLRLSQHLPFLVSLLYYGLSVVALVIGSMIIASLMPTVLSIPFTLLSSLGLVFILSWIHYLYMTALFLVTPPPYDNATLLILGAGIYTEDVTPMLKQRLDRALQFARSCQTSSYFVVSGGQGPDEPISEALAMKRYLISQGIPSSHILMEDQSTNTYTNMQYSKRYIKLYPNPVVIITSEFHLLRALRLAQRHRIQTSGYGAPSPIQFRAKSLIHDYCGLLFQYPMTWLIFSIIIIILQL